MAQLIMLAVLIAGSIYLYRRFVADANRLAAKTRREEQERQSGAKIGRASCRERVLRLV